MSMMKLKPLAAGGKLMSRHLIGGGIAEHAASPSLCKSHRLMMRSQLIAPSAAGAFNYLPLGVRALQKLCDLIDREMEIIGCLKVNMSCLSSAAAWKKSGRWNVFGDELMKLMVSNTQHCLNPTHEEAITSMVASFGKASLKNLPLRLYQISTKFRDEPRPRFGLLRCREFLMKDLYTFDTDIQTAKTSYDEVCASYKRICERLGLQYIMAKSSCGNIGGQMSHEFLVSSPIGEDTVFITDDGLAWNAEYSENMDYDGKASELRAIEIGHTFLLGTLYSKIFNASFVTGEGGPVNDLYMGCYGLGVSRILAACVESLSSDECIKWPDEICPFRVCIIPPKEGSKEHRAVSDMEINLFHELNKLDGLQGDIIIDDRTSRTIGKRVKDAELIGFPLVIVLGKGLLSEDPYAEVIIQNKNVTMNVHLSDIYGIIKNEIV